MFVSTFNVCELNWRFSSIFIYTKLMRILWAHRNLVVFGTKKICCDPNKRVWNKNKTCIICAYSWERLVDLIFVQTSTLLCLLWRFGFEFEDVWLLIHNKKPLLKSTVNCHKIAHCLDTVLQSWNAYLTVWRQFVLWESNESLTILPQKPHVINKSTILHA
jgi:hypothetical protein